MPVRIELDARGRRLRAALAAVLVKADEPELWLMHECDLQLTAYAGRDWRANFFTTGIAHSIVGGTGWEPTPWRAVQRAAWAAVKNLASSDRRTADGRP